MSELTVLDQPDADFVAPDDSFENIEEGESLTASDELKIKAHGLIDQFEADIESGEASVLTKGGFLIHDVESLLTHAIDHSRSFKGPVEGQVLDQDLFIAAIETANEIRPRLERLRITADKPHVVDSWSRLDDVYRGAIDSLDKLKPSFVGNIPQGMLDKIGLPALEALANSELEEANKLWLTVKLEELGIVDSITPDMNSGLAQTEEGLNLSRFVAHAAYLRFYKDGKLPGGVKPNEYGLHLGDHLGFKPLEYKNMYRYWMNNNQSERESEDDEYQRMDPYKRLLQGMAKLDEVEHLASTGIDVVGLRRRFGIREFSRYFPDRLRSQMAERLENPDNLPVNLVVTAPDDHNGAMRNTEDRYTNLEIEGPVIFAEAASGAAIIRQIINASNFADGPISRVFIHAHASADGLRMSRTEGERGFISTESISSMSRLQGAANNPSGILADDAEIYTWGCNTGAEDGPAETINRVAGFKTHGPDFISYGMVKDDDGKLRFRGKGDHIGGKTYDRKLAA